MSRQLQPCYVCGHSPAELDRLEAQPAFFEPITRRLFETAGLGPGMRVLDIGCGVGDVSFLAAETVGPSGEVRGVDRSREALALAKSRAAARGLSRVSFEHAEIAELTLTEPVDALVGRFVLMHQTDPARTLHEAARHVRSGGIIAILESHMSASVAGAHSCPHSPTYDRILGWLVEIIRAAGAHPDLGLRLPRVFADAGLPQPILSVQARAEGGPEAAIYRYTTESLRSMLPLAERLGIVTLLPAEIDDLERQLREEVTGNGGVLTSPFVVGAHCRIP